MTATRQMLNKPPVLETKLQILLKEYDTLRAEILARINHRNQIIAVCGAVLALAAIQPKTLAIYLVGGAMLAAIAIGWYRAGWLVARCSIRLQQIERHVNELMGENLLVWENQIGRTSFYRKLFPRQLHRPLSPVIWNNVTRKN